MPYINNINSSGEWARLDHQARIVGKRMGLLPSQFDDVPLTKILDVGCGSGRWTLDIAFSRPDAEVIGILGGYRCVCECTSTLTTS